MDLPEQEDGLLPLVERPLVERPLSVTAAFEGIEEIAEARDLARSFLADVQTKHGLAVPSRATGMVELVVSELVTNSRKFAPGPCLLTLEITGEEVEITVWDSEPCLPVACGADPGRVGRHGLEIVIAVCRSFAMHREPVGKRVTATVALADDPVGDEAGPL